MLATARHSYLCKQVPYNWCACVCVRVERARIIRVLACNKKCERLSNNESFQAELAI